MAGMVYGTTKSEYHGLPQIFEFINDDGGYVHTNCGQAASATLLSHYGVFKPTIETAGDIMRAIEADFPPDNLGGWLGTSRRRVVRICKEHGVRVTPLEGEEALRAELDRGNPVVVMLGVSGGKFWGYDLPGGHWMVAFGYDAEYVYLTNCGWMTWDEFRAGWVAFVPRLIQMRGRGLAAVP
jgi:hypothetical protein